MLSCFYKNKNNNKKKNFAKGLDRTVLAIGLYDPTPVLGVHRINKKNPFFMLKKPVFIPVSGFYSPTSRFGSGLKILELATLVILKVMV